MASTYLTRTQSASPTSDKIGTISFWVKRTGILTAPANTLSAIYQDSSNRMHFYFDDTDNNFKIY